MRLLKSPGLVLAVAVAVVALPAVATGALPSGKASPARIAANEVTYQDSTGENPTAADIATLVASNNDAGVISIRLNIPNRPTLTQDMLVLVWFDSDNNTQTGDGGADYAILLFRGDVALLRWNGVDGYVDAPSPSLIFNYQAGVTFTINSSEIGNTRRFGFATRVWSGVVVDGTTGAIDFTPAVADDAPGAGGFYPFEVRITPPTLVVRRVTTSPAVPRAGRTFTMRLIAARSDTGATIQNGRVTCVGRAGTTRLRAQVARVVAGAATCTWQIPANAKGKTFRGSTTIAFEGLRASRSITRKIS